jgi:hypothetical protein
MEIFSQDEEDSLELPSLLKRATQIYEKYFFSLSNSEFPIPKFFPKKFASESVDFEKNLNILHFNYRFSDNFSVLVNFSENFPFHSRLNPRKFSNSRLLRIKWNHP